MWSSNKFSSFTKTSILRFLCSSKIRFRLLMELFISILWARMLSTLPKETCQVWSKSLLLKLNPISTPHLRWSVHKPLTWFTQLKWKITFLKLVLKVLPSHGWEKIFMGSIVKSHTSLGNHPIWIVTRRSLKRKRQLSNKREKKRTKSNKQRKNLNSKTMLQRNSTPLQLLSRSQQRTQRKITSN